MKVWKVSFEWQTLCKSLLQRLRKRSAVLRFTNISLVSSASVLMPSYLALWRTDKEKATWISPRFAGNCQCAEPILKTWKKYGFVAFCVKLWCPKTWNTPQHAQRQLSRTTQSTEGALHWSLWKCSPLTKCQPQSCETKNMKHAWSSVNKFYWPPQHVCCSCQCIRMCSEPFAMSRTKSWIYLRMKHSEILTLAWKKGKWPVKVAYGSRLWDAEIEQTHSTYLSTYFIRLDLPFGPFQCCALFLLYNQKCWKLKQV